MKVQIKQFNSHQTAKVVGLLIALSSLLLMIPFTLMFSFMPTPAASSLSVAPFTMLTLVMPVFQGLFGYVLVRVGAWIYNKIAPRTGGFEFELEEINT